jgi:hypothetical protein
VSLKDITTGLAHGGGELATECAKGTASLYAVAMYILVRDHSESCVEDLIANLEGFGEISDQIDSLSDRAMQAILPADITSSTYQKTRSGTVTAGNIVLFIERIAQNGLSVARNGLAAARNNEKEFSKEIKRFHVKPATQEAEKHILKGHFGKGMENKSIFPRHWTREDVMKAVNGLSNDKSISWKPTRSGPNGEARYAIEGLYDNIMVRVVVEEGRGIVTAYPIK